MISRKLEPGRRSGRKSEEKTSNFGPPGGPAMPFS